ncbi:hypothetical protein P4311_17480 [Bacillus thuringiensis]|nr:hypothetical protein [Bacillus thuringiensis]MRB58662.1 hypothetical protein [Bacillus thuringiensis]
MKEWLKELDRRTPKLDRDQYYRGNLIWRPKGNRNKPLKGYVIKSSKAHFYFLHDKELKRFAGGHCIGLEILSQ